MVLKMVIVTKDKLSSMKSVEEMEQICQTKNWAALLFNFGQYLL